jgi:type IV pilus assembly protein PilM
MAFFDALLRLVKDPPAEYAFEVSEAGLAWVAQAAPERAALEPFPEGALRVNPVKPNFAGANPLPEALRAALPPLAKPHPRRAVVALPDYCARVAVLDFDTFPTHPEEQNALARFRLKRAVPFEIESALVACYPQPKRAGAKSLEVVSVAISREIVTQYLAPFRAAGVQCGVITLSGLAALALDDAATTAATRWMQVKRAGRILTVALMERSALRLFRCLELERGDLDEIIEVLTPTLIYAEDEFGGAPERVRLCGFDAPMGEELGRALQLEVERVHSPRAAVNEANAGALGLLTATEVGWAR